jgi:NADAR domain
MEEMTEVELEGKKYVWDGNGWCDARTYMEPAESVVNRLNELYRKAETRSAPAPRPRAPRRAAAPRFVPAKSIAPPPPPPKPIEKLTLFEGESSFLSNDSPATVYLDGQAFPSVALAFGAAKQLHDRLRPGMQREWDDKRPALMRRLLRSKFAHPQLRAALVATADKHLSHTAADADPFWNAPGGEGENRLGRLLMELRAQINKSYHLLRDEEIVEHLREYLPENPLVPNEALMKEPAWKRIEELYDLYKDELSPELMPALKARREHLLGQRG